MKEKLSVTVSVINDFGLHARPASKFVEIALQASGNIWVIMETEQVDGKSLIDLLSLGAVKDSSITIKIDNPDDKFVLNQIADFVQQGFWEL